MTHLFTLLFHGIGFKENSLTYSMTLQLSLMHFKVQILAGLWKLYSSVSLPSPYKKQISYFILVKTKDSSSVLEGKNKYLAGNLNK